MELVQHWIGQYGYFGIFGLLVLGIVGLPVPDETLLTLVGYLLSRGKLHFAPAMTAALLGSACGITLSYLLGRTTGYYLLHRYGPRVHVTQDKLDRVHAWFKRFGGLTLTFGYYVPGVRHLTAYVAGTSKLEYPVFAAFGYTGAVLWTATFISLGYFLGEHWSEALSHEHNMALIVCGLALGGALLWWLRRLRRRKGDSPRTVR
jgi:membrane protein DedA with SNARE-associated domain